MKKGKYYSIGYDTGRDIAETNIQDLALMSEDDFISAMSEHESDVYRQYTPFEFLAKEMNDWEERWNQQGKLWESYERGVYDGIKAIVKENR